MEDKLMQKLWNFIVKYNPDLMFMLQEEYKVMDYLHNEVSEIMITVDSLVLDGIPEYEIEEKCMMHLTQSLRPSRYCFVKDILEEDFEEIYNRLEESGILIFEVLNMLSACTVIFDELGYTEENEDNRFLRYAITGVIEEYLSV